jgi:hypothetical protein
VYIGCTRKHENTATWYAAPKSSQRTPFVQTRRTAKLDEHSDTDLNLHIQDSRSKWKSTVSLQRIENTERMATPKAQHARHIQQKHNINFWIRRPCLPTRTSSREAKGFMTAADRTSRLRDSSVNRERPAPEYRHQHEKETPLCVDDCGTSPPHEYCGLSQL